MRKQQIKILDNAKKQDYSQAQIDVLSREDIIIAVLNVVSDYFYTQNKFELNKDLTALEATKWIDFLVSKKDEGEIVDTNSFVWLLEKFLPCYFNKDTLLGDSEKHRLWRTYRFTEAWSAKNREDGEIKATERQVLYLYKELLYVGLSSKEIRPLIRKSVEKEVTRSACSEIVAVLHKYPLLLDDYTYNGKDSLLWKLIEKDIVGKFAPNKEALGGLYDADEHRFCFKPEDFEKYFIYKYYDGWIEDKLSIADMKKSQYPIVEHVIDFCKSHNMRSENNTYMQTFYKWNKWQLWDESQLEKLNQCYKLLGRPFKTGLGAWSLSVSISPNFFTSIVYSEYTNIVVDGNSYFANGWHTENPFTTVNMFVTPDGKIFECFGNSKKTQKNVPLSMSAFMHYLDKDNLFGEIVRSLFEFHSKRNPFFKDVLNDCKQCGCIIPINFNDMCDYYNRAHYLNSKYKLSKQLKVNWNKQNINLSYCIIKAYPWIEPGVGQQILLQQKDVCLVPDPHARGVDEKIMSFVTSIICHNVFESENKERKKKAKEIKQKYNKEIAEEVQTDVLEDELNDWLDDRVADELGRNELRREIYDYVRMCRQTKTKIRIDVRSIRQLENLHDFAANGQGYYRTHASLVKVPKKSKFLKLRDMLPQEFEWIKTRKRLVLETELQHHCVWSYADKITADNCAIYSFVDKSGEFGVDGKPKRYTIEFEVNKKGKYHIIQVQGKYDRANTGAMRAYIQSILDEAQDGEKKD